MPYIICEVCKKKAYKRKAELNTARFCSYACKYENQRRLTPDKHGRWSGGERSKECVGCKKVYSWFDLRIPLSIWKQRKYCTLECSRKHQTDYVLSGKDHPRFKGKELTPRYVRQKEWRTKRYQDWRTSVFERDAFTCQMCNKKGGDLQADHIKTWAEYPELRYELSNGRTLCVTCHRTTFKFHRNQYSE